MIRDETIRRAVEYGLLPEDIGQEFDDWSDELVARVEAGTLDMPEAERLTKERAAADVERARLRGYPKDFVAVLFNDPDDAAACRADHQMDQDRDDRLTGDL